MAKIQIFFAGELQREFLLDDQIELKVGRGSECDLVIDSVAISRHHCTLREIGRKWHIIDEGSANGVFVNGKQVENYQLSHDDRVVFGKHTLVFDQLGTGRDPRLSKTNFGASSADLTMQLSVGALNSVLERSQKKQMALVTTQPLRQIVRLTQDVTVIGKGPNADLIIKGWFVRDEQATVIKTKFGFRIVHAGGLRRMRVNGENRDEVYLWAGDVITIAGNRISFGSL